MNLNLNEFPKQSPKIDSFSCGCFHPDHFLQLFSTNSLVSGVKFSVSLWIVLYSYKCFVVTNVSCKFQGGSEVQRTFFGFLFFQVQEHIVIVGNTDAISQGKKNSIQCNYNFHYLISQVFFKQISFTYKVNKAMSLYQRRIQ